MKEGELSYAFLIIIVVIGVLSLIAGLFVQLFGIEYWNAVVISFVVNVVTTAIAGVVQLFKNLF